MSLCRRAFTLIELLIVIVILAVVIGILLPSLSSAKKSAVRRSLESPAPQIQQFTAARVAQDATINAAHPDWPSRPLAIIKSFEATVSLTPRLSVGTADPESIYTAQVSAKFQAVSPRTGECEILLPLPPQIISLADLTVLVNEEPSESIAIRGDKLVWYGTLPAAPVPMSVTYSAVGKGLYNLQPPPSTILDVFHIDLTAVGSDVRMLELSLQPTKHVRAEGKTIYTWDYKRLLFGQPIALDVLGVAPIDRLGELAWLGPASVVIFGLLLGLVARAFNVQKFDRWVLMLILGTFTGAYPLMYFAQEFIPLSAAIITSAAVVVLIIAVRSTTMMGLRAALLGVVIPASVILTATLMAAIQTRLQGILITSVGIALFVVAMLLMPKLKLELPGPKPSLMP